ncbi:DUF1697 domain-containing protein [Streptomyces sp. MUM 203J]|uniref:DUF1697 domain-containing protein n=1 Tax=Streptomyces sp. MUM 203J TaxID=2791990 RepID=UPI001F03462B|nr:DUF1697 domain-containing protein [Streptomyces sp. MUM 203J]MCH0541520.1 DUF1697 domain-containing protein [Streptomyces sp. MUM 203J]
MTTITRYAVLLRGINVGTSRKVPMAELRTVLTDLGHTDVKTYLQSGNAAFTTDSKADEATLTKDLEQAVRKHFGFEVHCLIREADYLRRIVEDCPFPAADLQPKQLHVTYFSASVTPARFAAVDQEAYAPEEFRLGDRALYLYAPDGLGRSRLAEVLSRPALLKGITATTRNWNTVLKLAEMAQEPTA